jgi:hypothetical protein
MKYPLLSLLILLGLAACTKQDTSAPKYTEQILYSGDSVRYNLDSLPARLEAPPKDYNDYYRLVQVYSDYTMTLDYTHVEKYGMSVTYRGFIRYGNGTYDFKGWYRRRRSNGYIIPANKDVAVYRTVPYDQFMESGLWEEVAGDK